MPKLQISNIIIKLDYNSIEPGTDVKNVHELFKLSMSSTVNNLDILRQRFNLILLGSTQADHIFSNGMSTLINILEKQTAAILKEGNHRIDCMNKNNNFWHHKHSLKDTTTPIARFLNYQILKANQLIESIEQGADQKSLKEFASSVKKGLDNIDSSFGFDSHIERRDSVLRIAEFGAYFYNSMAHNSQAPGNYAYAMDQLNTALRLSSHTIPCNNLLDQITADELKQITAGIADVKKLLKAQQINCLSGLKLLKGYQQARQIVLLQRKTNLNALVNDKQSECGTLLPAKIQTIKQQLAGSIRAYKKISHKKNSKFKRKIRNINQQTQTLRDKLDALEKRQVDLMDDINNINHELRQYSTVSSHIGINQNITKLISELTNKIETNNQSKCYNSFELEILQKVLNHAKFIQKIATRYGSDSDQFVEKTAKAPKYYSKANRSNYTSLLFLTKSFFSGGVSAEVKALQKQADQLRNTTAPAA